MSSNESTWLKLVEYLGYVGWEQFELVNHVSKPCTF